MRFWKRRRAKQPAISYEQARETVRQATEPNWTHGTYCLDDRQILETDQYYWFQVGAREFLIEDDSRFTTTGPEPVVDKQTGELRWLPAHEIGWDPTLRRTPNPNPTCDGPVAPSVGHPPSYEEARELVRSQTEPNWTHGTYCLDDRSILENDEYYVFVVGAREFLIDGDHSYAILGGNPIVYKADGRMETISSAQVGMDSSLRSRPNPHPTVHLDEPSGGEGAAVGADAPEPPPNLLTYAILFRDPVTDEDVAAIADAILHQRGYGDAPEDLYARAVAGASDERCTPKERDYLRRLVEVLDARRPWPTLPYTSVHPTNVDLRGYAPVGTVALSALEMENVLRRSFQPVSGPSRGDFLVLRIAEHTVAFQSQSSRTATGVSVLLPGDTDDPGGVVALLAERTGLPIEPTR